MSHVNSTTYIKRPPNISPKEECVLYTKEVLRGRLFMGSYEERKYVPLLDEYRDVIVINNEESELFRDLDKVRKKWRQTPGVKWLGLTGPDDMSEQNNYCFWVKLTDTAFGNYWFQIKHLKLVEDELCLAVKCIRKASSICSPASSSFVGNEFSTSGQPSFTNKCLKTYGKSQAQSILKGTKDAYASIEPMLTWANFFKGIRISFASVILVVMGFVSFLKYASDYFLLLIRELSYFAHALSPIVVQLIDFCTKVVGALFILVAGFCRIPFRNNFEVHHNRPSIVHYEPSRQLPVNTNWRERNRMLREELLAEQNKPLNNWWTTKSK